MRRLDLKEEEFKSLKKYIALTKSAYKDAYFDNKVSFGNYKKISGLLVKLESLKKHRVRYDKTKTKRYMEENAIYAASSKLSCSKGVLFLRKVDGEFGFYEKGDKNKVRKYLGEIENGLPNWQGTLTSPDGTKYKGGFKDGEKHGQGTIKFIDGRKYVGEWKNGKYNGRGTFTWKNGDKYEGEYKDNLKHGQGTLSYKSGHVEEGEWKDGKFWDGVLRYPSSSIPGFSKRHTWIKGKKLF